MIERYTLSPMRRLFSDERKMELWTAVELAALYAVEEEGVAPRGTAALVESALADLDYTELQKRAREIERETDHDLVAFTMALEERAGEAGRWIHYGLTSSDVVDTAQALQLKEAGGLLGEQLEGLLQELRDLAVSHKKTPAMGRTHGVYAEPTSLGLRLLSHYAELDRCREGLAGAFRGAAVGQLSGAVGNYAHLPARIEELVLSRLGLEREDVPTQVVARDRHARLLTELALTGGAIERFALNVRLDSRTEVGELYEPFGKGQRGSSAMPHKRNPVLCERLGGIARMLRGYASAGLEDIALWHERDISHSSVERVALVDAIVLLHYGASLARRVAAGLVVDESRMAENRERFGDYYLSQPLLLALVRAGAPRKEAYVVVKELAQACHKERNGFKEAALADGRVGEWLSPNETEEALGVDYLAGVDEVFNRVLGISPRASPRRRRKPLPSPRREKSRGRE